MGSTVLITATEVPLVLAQPMHADSKSIPFTELLIRSKTSPPKSIVADLFNNEGLLPIPGRAGELAALEVSPSRYAYSVHAEKLDANSYEVVRSNEEKAALIAVASGMAGAAENSAVRVFTVMGVWNHDAFSYLNRFRYVFQEKLLVQARLLGNSSAVESTREFKDVAHLGANAMIVAVDDCDSDGEEDLLLIIHEGEENLDGKPQVNRGAECELLSGKDLQTIAPIPTPEKLGRTACRVPDIDGDGLQDVLLTGMTEHDYFLISPKARKLVQRVDFAPIGGAACSLRGASDAGRTAQGEAIMAVAFVSADAPSVDQIAVINVLTGRALGPAARLDGRINREQLCSPEKPFCGRIPGGNRRWLAYATSTPSIRGPVHLFVQELGVPGSRVEVLLPTDERRYAGAICAVAAADSTYDCLAITVAPAEPKFGSAMDFDPVMFLDVTRCFEQR